MDSTVPNPSVCPHCRCDCSLIGLGAGCGFGRTASAGDATAALIEGKPASLEDAVDRAAGILEMARYPLIYGLTCVTCEAQRAAVALADRIGACVDSANAPRSALFPDLGTITCTLGEIKNRADLIVFWGGRPDQTHPMLAANYALDPIGRFLPDGRRARKVVVVGERVTADAYSADLFLPKAAGGDFAALWLLRALVQSKPVDPNLGPVAGIPLDSWRGLANALKQCKFGVIIIHANDSGPRTLEAAHGLATDLNAFTRFYVLALRLSDNGLGAEQVLTWQTGFPAAVSLSAGFPRSFAGEFSAETILRHREADAAVLVGIEFIDELSAAAREHLQKIPVVAMSSQIASLTIPATVAITTTLCANPAGGTAFRLDGLALPIRPAFSSSFPDDFQVLKRIERIYRRTAAPTF